MKYISTEGILLICQDTTMLVYEPWIKDMKRDVKKYIAPQTIC